MRKRLDGTDSPQMKTYRISILCLGEHYDYTEKAQKPSTAIGRAYRKFEKECRDRYFRVNDVLRNGELIIQITENSSVMQVAEGPCVH